MPNTVAIILARGGSKGIPRKNIMNFCGKPLIAWSIECAKNANSVSSVWVSSDSEEILEIAKKYDANIIKRPKSLATDKATSISAYLHAIKEIQSKTKSIDAVIAVQITSPVRESKDIEAGIRKFHNYGYDSMFSAARIGDFYIWKMSKQKKLSSVNYNYKKRPRRQDFGEQFVENGSFYIFKPQIIQKYNNQLGGKIGVTLMEFWKSFEIDDVEDVEFCKIIMEHYLLRNSKKR